MAYALALKCFDDLVMGPVILIDTLIYALFSILGIGSFLNPMLEKLGVKRNPEEQEMTDLAGPSNQDRNCCVRMKSRIRLFDNEYFSPLFIK